MFNRNLASGILVFALLGNWSCTSSEPPRTSDSAAIANLGPPATDVALSPGEGRLHVDGGRIWYRVAGTGTGTPLILLHGGPGLNSYALTSLEALGNDRPVVRYDQLGGGKSDGLTDITKMNLPHFVAELEALRAELGFERVHLFGHSWGAMLALEYYRAHPEHVASLTMAGALLDVPAWAENTKRLSATLSAPSHKAIQESAVSGDFSSVEYEAAVTEFAGRYMWLHPVTAEADSSKRQLNQQLYQYMQGRSEFAITGTLKDYNATAYLKDVKVPVLYTVGEFDEAGPALVRKFASATPGARFVLIRGAAHVTMWDNPAAMNSAVGEFLAGVDRGAVRNASATP